MTTDVVVKILAVVGGAVVGGLGLGLLAQLLARAFTTQKIKGWPNAVIRLLGGGICGWLVALWLFGGGGPGIGGSGGWGLGSGSGQGESERKTLFDQTKPDRKKPDTNGTATPPQTLRIEILGGEALQKLGKDSSHPYRVREGDAQSLWSLDEVKQAIKKRQEQDPPLSRLEVVLYKDSPDKDVPLVKRLVDWGRDLDIKGDGKMKVDLTQPDSDAPLK
jgi:hypothetical protein